MRYLQYLGPYDSFDASNIAAKPNVVFYTPTTQAVPPDQRGNVIHLTNETSEELLTYPGHTFAEVDEGPAKELTAKQQAARKVREQQYALFAADSDNIQVVAPSVEEQIAAVPVAIPAAASAPATAAQIRAEARAASNPVPAAATPAPTTDTSSTSATTMQPTGDSTDTASTPTGA